MSEVEKELLVASKFTPKKNYADRQDYLAALGRATIQINEDDFDNLSNEAADWSNAAVAAIREKKVIPDFPDVEAVETAPSIEDEFTPEDKVPYPEPAKQKRGKQPKQLDHPPITHPDDVGDGPILLDRYGVAVGSKSAAAVAMFEGGARMADVNATIGGNYYNLLRRLEQAGHKIEKLGKGTLRLVHKDDQE